MRFLSPILSNHLNKKLQFWLDQFWGEAPMAPHWRLNHLNYEFNRTITFPSMFLIIRMIARDMALRSLNDKEASVVI
jgi:hypothetical protein